MIEYRVVKCERNDIKDFIEKHHYSKSINGCISDYCFMLLDGSKMIGACFFGRMAMAGQWKKYTDNPDEITELRRLCCVDNTKKNTESFFISKCLKWLKLNTKINIVISYADPYYSHTGVIYRACSFKYLGQSSRGRFIMWNGKKYHDKTIRTKYKGVLKPFAKKVKDALDKKEAYYVQSDGKHIYLKNIVRKRKSRPKNKV